MNLKNTETEKNLFKALQGEALAHMKYMIYASLIGKTSKDMERQILEIANNEKEHWKIYSKLLLEDDYYNNFINLEDAIEGENKECTLLYNEFGRIAREEGFDEIAESFEAIGNIECFHKKHFDLLLEKYGRIEDLMVSDEPTIWKCSNCGYIYKGVEVPEVCPVCKHPKNYFM